jgi:hypothetical protein
MPLALMLTWLHSKDMARPTKKIQFGTGAIQAPVDYRDRIYDGIAFSAAPFDWNTGYDIEKVINTTIPFKDQDGSSSCVGQAWSYYTGVLNTVETGKYTVVSAKAYYSQIALDGGGAYIRDGGKLSVDWGAVEECIVPSYENGKAPSETFMRDKTWKDNQDDILAQRLKAKEFRMVADITMEIIAQGIRDNHGVVGGVNGANNGSWNSLEPIPGKKEWGHALFFGKAGIDNKGKYIATPNSWGDRFGGQWQKLRAEWFTNEYMFNPWLLIDQVNTVSAEIIQLMKDNNKGMLIENEAPGRKGIIYNNKLMEVLNGREGNAALYLIENKTGVTRVSKNIFDQVPKGNNF